MSSDEPGLLGNLPRSRPGTRSDKRATASKPPARPKTAAAKKRAKPAAPRPAAATAPRKPAPRPVPAPEPNAPAGPLRSAAKVAGTGLRVAEGVTREVLRRLPRP
jgi:hypothetical protein